MKRHKETIAIIIILLFAAGNLLGVFYVAGSSAYELVHNVFVEDEPDNVDDFKGVEIKKITEEQKQQLLDNPYWAKDAIENPTDPAVKYLKEYVEERK